MTIANLLVGNAPEAAALEITLGQVDVQFTRHCWFALTGAACEATLDGAGLVGLANGGEGRAAAGAEKSSAWDPQLSGGRGRY